MSPHQMLPFPTADPVALTHTAYQFLPLTEDGTRYACAGLPLTDPTPAGTSTSLDLFHAEHEDAGIPTLTDQVQKKTGRE